MEVRCDSGIKHGEIINGLLEVRCRSNRCGHQAGVVVLHRFSLATGELQETLQFRDPAKQGVSDGADQRSALRSA